MAFAFLNAAPALAQQFQIDVTPEADTNFVGRNHTVTATVTLEGAPVAGADVHFDVTGAGAPAPIAGDATTAANGEATFIFTNSQAGVNTITACLEVIQDDSCGPGELTDSATKTWSDEQPVPTEVGLAPPSATNPVGSDHTVTATVTDQYGDPFPLAAVRFGVTSEGIPTPSSGGATTDAQGQASFTFSNTQAVTNIITACVDEDAQADCDVGEPSATAIKSWEVRVPTTIDLAPATDTNPVGSDHTVTATVTDQFDAPFQGADVSFAVTGAGAPIPASGSAVTGVNGEATFTFSNDLAGTNTIAACIDQDDGGDCDLGEPADTAAKTWTRSPTDIALSPATDTNPVGSDHTVTATVTDEAGLPFQGVPVRFAVTGPGTPTPATGGATTDADGEATFTFSNNAAGTNTIVACIDQDAGADCDPGEPSDTAKKTWVDRIPTNIVLTPSTDTNPVGSDHTVTATVTDQFDAPFQGSAVRFAVNGAGAPTPAVGSASTDAEGEATFTFSNDFAGSNTITGCVDVDGGGDCDLGEPSDTATKTWERSPTDIVLTPSTDTNPVGSDHTVTATVTDEAGLPFQGVAVRFAVTGSGAPSPASGGATTNAQGQASFTFSNAFAGTNTVTSCIDQDAGGDCDPGEPLDTVTKSWEVRVPTTIVLAPPADTNLVGSNHTVTATVTDQFDALFQGAPVRFSVTPQGVPLPSSGEATTNTQGQASFTFSNDFAATNTITACVDLDVGADCDPAEPSDTATKTWQDPVLDIALSPANGVNPIGTIHTVTATVTDQFDAPSGGADVHFAVTGNPTPGPASGDAATNANGQATFTYSNNQAGMNTITACIDQDDGRDCDAGEPSATVTAAWQAPPLSQSSSACPGLETDSRNQVVGTPGDDQLTGTPEADIICGLGGNDTINGLGGNDLIIGGDGNDTVRGAGGNDRLKGDAGRDNLRGGAGNDRLNGGSGRDSCKGGGGVDVVRGCEK